MKMNKNKEEYIKAINEIKVGDNIKNKILDKVKEKKSHRPIYGIASVAIVAIIAISIAIPMRNKQIDKQNDPAQIIAEQGGLPKLKGFEQLYKIVEENDTSYYNLYGANKGEVAIAEIATTNDANKTSEKSTNNTSSDYSTTNIQVEGVDEADIVKTDGEYIYYVGSNKITIVDGRDSKDLKMIKEIEYENDNKNQTFYPQEIYLKDNKLIVIGIKNVYEKNTGDEEYYYGYMSYSKQYTLTKVYNVENKNKPKLEREVEIEGNYLSSRMIEDNIYVISNKYLYLYLFKGYETDEINEDDFKPKYTDSIVSKEEKKIEFTDISYFPESEDTDYLNIAGFNINNNEPANIQTYLGAGDEIYSSENNLYITKVKYEYKDNRYYGYYNNYDVNTYIYKFKLDNGKATYSKVGTVPGYIINQFAMDEKDGYFRIATTDSQSWNSETNTNNLYILNENLEIVSQVENLAKGEKIYSVRFMGNRAYMVTFVQTDPLFVIDLSNPTNPTVLGELKIPGYSKYLHPYDENHIIGFGEDTETVNYGYGDVVKTTGMKMALFDVTDPNDPKEMYNVKIGDRGTYSELLYNHKALLFSKEKNIIAFPITISQDVSNYKSNLKFQGAIVYGLDLEKGFTLRGQIAHRQIQDGYRNYDYSKEVERIIYIKDTLFTLSKGIIKSTDLNTMEELDSVEIQTENEDYYMYNIVE